MLCWPRFYFCVACLKASQRNQGSDMWLKDVDLQIDVGTLTPTSRENQHSSVSKLWNNRRKQWRRHSPRRSRHTSSYFFPLNVHYQHCNLSVRQFQALVLLCCVVELCVCVCVCVCMCASRFSQTEHVFVACWRPSIDQWPSLGVKAFFSFCRSLCQHRHLPMGDVEWGQGPDY